jgi:hypothetical protein
MNGGIWKMEKEDALAAVGVVSPNHLSRFSMEWVFNIWHSLITLYMLGRQG